jgi:hypothetical protein
VAPVPYGMCGCIDRAWRNDPLPEEDMPIYPPYVNLYALSARQREQAAVQAWADRQVTPEEMQTSAPSSDSVYVTTATEESTS